MVVVVAWRDCFFSSRFNRTKANPRIVRELLVPSSVAAVWSRVCIKSLQLRHTVFDSTNITKIS